jgi:hypothetical protein
LGDFEFICIRVLNGFFDFRDHDFIRGDAFGDNALDFYASEREKIGNFRDGFSGKVKVSGEPVK